MKCSSNIGELNLQLIFAAAMSIYLHTQRQYRDILTHYLKQHRAVVFSKEPEGGDIKFSNIRLILLPFHLNLTTV